MIKRGSRRRRRRGRMSCPRLTNYFQVLYFRNFDIGLIYWHIRSRRTCVQLHAFSFIFHPESTFLAAPDYISVLFGYICMRFTQNQHCSLLQIHISVLFGYICMRFPRIFLCSSDIFSCVLPRRRVYIIRPIGHSIPTVTHRHS